MKITPAIFQQVIDMMLSGLDYAVAYLDNIFQKSETPGEHKIMFSRIQAEKRKNDFLEIKSNIWDK